MNRRIVLRWMACFAAVAVLSGCSIVPSAEEVTTDLQVSSAETSGAAQVTPPAVEQSATGSAAVALAGLPVKGRAPKAGYARSQFGKAWTDENTALWGGDSLSTRENILSRDLTNVICKAKPAAPVLPPCVVQSGILTDPYTGVTLNFVRGQESSQLVPIDHVVALGDAWQKGGQQITAAERVNLANDPLNLIATTRAPNSAKSDSDSASWLVPNWKFRCMYVARQIAVKSKYRLWVTKSEGEAMERVLARCPGQSLPTEAEASQRTVSP
ncbi:HNH endonuclease family protein [Gordonia liuliyuniae]|uniref:HNH endonuclease family protein n=1 Tax=Gordonia liuliyuniae TaxID=2911517 RepID=A0ABS9IWC4_9ACTN|nr:HNH endonuclease family protein [Gordonia liuliyuniae]MCF8589867.1 HNH endonuclease family protein [Gordonia liuliyuniae]